MVLHHSNSQTRRVSQAENAPPTRLGVVSTIKNHASRQRAMRRANNAPPQPAVAARRLRSRPRTSVQFEFPLPIHLVPPPVAPSNDVEMAPPAPGPTKTLVKLPRYLYHPERKEPRPEVVEASVPDLEGVPLQYARDKLPLLSGEYVYISTPYGHRLIRPSSSSSMFKVLTGAKIVPPMGALPKEIEVSINDVSSDMPTHVLALYCPLIRPDPNAAVAPKRRITLYPIHSTVFAVHCASLPQLPPSHPEPVPIGGTITVPVLPIGLPSPSAFPFLSHYLYHRRPDKLIASLIPCPPPVAIPIADDASVEEKRNAEKETIKAYAMKCAAMLTPHALLDRTLLVN